MSADDASSHSVLRLPPRRRFLMGAGQAGLSAVAVALLAGCESMAAHTGAPAAGPDDVGILNTALGLEHEAIAAYQLGAESGLLEKPACRSGAMSNDGCLSEESPRFLPEFQSYSQRRRFIAFLV